MESSEDTDLTFQDHLSSAAFGDIHFTLCHGSASPTRGEPGWQGIQY